MGFPRPAQMKPKKINYGARMAFGGGVVAYSVGFWVVTEFVFDLYRPLKNYMRSLDCRINPKAIENRIRALDEEALGKLNAKHGYTTVNAAQWREAKDRWEDAQLDNEVREFFIERPTSKGEKSASESKDYFTSLETVKPGVYGKVVVTKSVDKENKKVEIETK